MLVPLWRAMWWTAAVACLTCAVSGSDAPTALAVYKCCAEGEELDTTAENESRCHAVAFDPNNVLHEWLPHVYDPIGAHLSREIPPHWQFRVGIVRCRRGHVIRVPVKHMYMPSFVLFVNGSIYLTEFSTIAADAGAYCLDARELLVCVSDEPEATAEASTSTPTPRPAVRKCCPDGAALVRRHDDVSCEAAPWPGAGALPRAAVDPRVFALREGSAPCEPRDLVEAGALRAGAAVLRQDGSLAPLGGRAALPLEDFCVERVLVVPGNGSPALGVDAPPMVFVCKARPAVASAASDPFTLSPVGLVLFVFFRAATLAAGYLFPDADHAMR